MALVTPHPLVGSMLPTSVRHSQQRPTSFRLAAVRMTSYMLQLLTISVLGVVSPVRFSKPSSPYPKHQTPRTSLVESIYYVDTINDTSKYVWWGDHPPVGSLGSTGANWGSDASDSGTEFKTLNTNAYSALTGGALVTPTDFFTDGYDLFKDSETVDVNLLLGGPLTGVEAKNLIALAEDRKDAVAFLSPPEAAVVNKTMPVSQLRTPLHTELVSTHPTLVVTSTEFPTTSTHLRPTHSLIVATSTCTTATTMSTDMCLSMVMSLVSWFAPTNLLILGSPLLASTVVKFEALCGLVTTQSSLSETICMSIKSTLSYLSPEKELSSSVTRLYRAS